MLECRESRAVSRRKVRVTGRGIPILMTICAVTAHAAPILPPIDYSGKLRSGHRLSVNEAGTDSLQNTFSGQLNTKSHVWRPWFGTWDIGANATHVLTESDVDSETSLFGGDGRVQLFPRSRIPFTAFANVQDSRIDLDTETVGSPDTRISRFGAMQQVRSRTGLTDASINVERNVFDVLNGDERDQTNDILRFRAKTRGTKNRVSADFNLLNSDRVNDDELSWDAIGRHGFKSDDRLSIDSSVRASRSNGRLDDSEEQAKLTRIALDSFGLWRAPESPLQITGKLNVRTELEHFHERFSDAYQTGSALIGARYPLTDALRLSGELGYQSRGDQGDIAHGVREVAAVAYAPESIEIQRFDYSYSANLTGRNDNFTNEKSNQSLQGFARHGVRRSSPVEVGKPLYLGIDLDQSLGGIGDTEGRDQVDLTHRVTGSLGRRTAKASTQVRGSFLDTRRLNGEMANSQTVNVTASHNQAISRRSDWSVTMTVSAIRSGRGGSNDRWGNSPFFDLDAEYRNRHLFGLQRLTYRSTLRFDSNGVEPFTLGAGGVRLSWENRFDYFIGLVNLQLRIINVNPGSKAINSFFLLVSRSF